MAIEASSPYSKAVISPASLRQSRRATGTRTLEPCSQGRDEHPTGQSSDGHLMMWRARRLVASNRAGTRGMEEGITVSTVVSRQPLALRFPAAECQSQAAGERARIPIHTASLISSVASRDLRAAGHTSIPRVALASAANPHWIGYSVCLSPPLFSPPRHRKHRNTSLLVGCFLPLMSPNNQGFVRSA